VEGTVSLRLLIDAQGAVTKIEVVQGIDLLTDAAKKGARRWRYKPGTRNGVVVPTWIDVDVPFRLER
jgi:protein TonB